MGGQQYITGFSRGQTQALLDGKIAEIAPPMPVWTPGRYYDTRFGSAGEPVATGGLPANTIVAALIHIPESVPIDRIGTNITTAGAAGKLIRLALYDSLATGLPGSLIVDSGNLAADAIAAVQATVALTLQPGWYWGAAVSDGTPTLTAYNATRSPANLGWAALTSTTLETAVTKTFTFAGFPASFGAITGYGSVAFRVALRAA